jgi:hypothetical protein
VPEKNVFIASCSRRGETERRSFGWKTSTLSQWRAPFLEGTQTASEHDDCQVLLTGFRSHVAMREYPASLIQQLSKLRHPQTRSARRLEPHALMTALRRWLEISTAQVRVAFVDACESGSLARTRGGQPVEAIALSVDDSLTMSGLAVITSTGPLSVARESASFGGGIFSRALLTGLRGSADADTDGQITLEEAYRYAFAETVVGTAGDAASIQKPEYRYEMSGVGQVVLTRVPSRAAGLILPEELEGIYTVISVSNGQVVARVDKRPGEIRRLALPTGRYVVRKVRREDVLLAELGLVWGGDRWIDDAQMSTAALGDPLSRGSWNPRPIRLSTRLTGAGPLFAGSPFTSGGEAELRFLLRPTLGLTVLGGGERGSREEWSGRLHTTTTRLGVGFLSE